MRHAWYSFLLNHLQARLRTWLDVPSQSLLITVVNELHSELTAEAEKRRDLEHRLKRREARETESDRFLSEAYSVAARTTGAIYELSEQILATRVWLQELEATSETELLEALRVVREKRKQHGSPSEGR